MSKFHKLVDRWGLSVFIIYAIVKLLYFLRNFGLKPKEDGWRKTTRVYLRTEEAKFILACLGLDFCSRSGIHPTSGFDAKKECVIKNLSDFLVLHPKVQWQVGWDRFSAKREQKEKIDFVLADFDLKGNLTKLTPYLDFTLLDHNSKNKCLPAVINAYNQTRALPDKKRPIRLKQLLDTWAAEQEVGIQAYCHSFINRVLSSIFITFETLPSDTAPKRFEPPMFITRKHPGWGALNIACRMIERTNDLDLWFQCQHTCVDGLPVQEVLSELKNKWQSSAKVKFPLPYQNINPLPQLCSTHDGEKGIYCVNQLIVFDNLISLAGSKNKKSVGENQRTITAFRLFIWKLGNHPVFFRKKFLIPVNLPLRGVQERTLGFVLIRPSDYYKNDSPENGLKDFEKEFNRQVKSAITRTGESYELLKTFALLPPVIYEMTLKLMPHALKVLVGSVGISLIDKAEIFVAPFSDVHTDGFIALSNFHLPTPEGKTACHVSIKGRKKKINDYLRAINEITNA
ncbi:MAG: hypothetical protein ABIH45_01015 [Candidatus Omnitrophota bacterium]